VSFRHCNSL
jgi:hypothetical protein